MQSGGSAAGCLDAPGSSRASGLVTVDGKTFPLRSASLEARAEGGLSESRLIQTYSNPYDEPLEVLYTLPLPADGAVIGYTIKLGERVITGRIESREQARESYRRALEQGRTAGLLEQARADTFTQTLGNLPAGAAAEIEMRVLHPLAFLPDVGNASACWEYRFPTVVGVRYEGAPGRVPDAADLDVDRAGGDGTPVRLDLDLRLADGTPAELLPHSPSHHVRIAPGKDGCRLSLDEDAPLDRDLVVQWRAVTEEIGLRCVEGGGLSSDNGRYALLTITPPERPQTTFARDLTILMDASGSMMGEPLAASKQVVQSLLDSLGPEDRFELLAFSMSVDRLVAGPVKASPRHLRQASRRLAALKAGGGTEMTRALIEALQPLRRESQRQVILVTDGFIGFEAEVIGDTLRRLQPGCRVHTVGIGSAPNRSLTRGVARAGRGTEAFVENVDAAPAAAERLLRATVGPVLTDLTVGGSACRTVAPERPRDVLAGLPLVLSLELEPAGGAIEVQGRLAGSNKPWEQSINVPRSTEAEPGEAGLPQTSLPIGALFGREAVEDAELQLASAIDRIQQQAFEATIESLGLRHQITTRRTSLVAVADEASVDPSEPRRRQRLEVELPVGVSAEGVGLVSDWMPLLSQETLGQMDSAVVGVTRSFDRIKDLAGARRSVRGVIEQKLGVIGTPATSLVVVRVVRFEDDSLVVEFESPPGGVELPPDGTEVGVRPFQGDGFTAVVVGSHSTRAGRHPEGLTLRLALRRKDGETWERFGARIEWREKNKLVLAVIVDLTQPS
jgi:Ca-activated chloride channel family protein